MGEWVMRVWFQVFDRPRCAICNNYSQPSQLFCSEQCKATLESLGLLDGRAM